MSHCFSFFKRSAAPRRGNDTNIIKQRPQHDTGFDHLNTCSACCFAEPLPEYESSEAFTDLEKSTPPDILADISKDIESKVQEISQELRDVSLRMWDTAEIAWKEKKTHDLLVNYLQSKPGWKITPHAYNLSTAFKAEFVHEGSQKIAGKLPTIGYQSELDALPGIGHACGHNLIAISGLAASLSTASALVAHDIPGRVILLGTPAEEFEGGKLKLLDSGAYKDMDACLMLHPAPMSSVGKMISVIHIKCHYKGQTAHAGAAPWEGVNAQDAGVLAYNNISALRQQIKPTHRVHGIIQGSNWAANVIPGECEVIFNVRAPTVAENNILLDRIKNCFLAAGQATGCSAEIEVGSTYYDVANSPRLADAYKGYMKERYQDDIGSMTFPASTDFGSVTYALPGLHAEYAIPLKNPYKDGNHTVGFASAARTQEAHELTLKSSVGIAVIGARILVDSSFRKKTTDEWKKWKKEQENTSAFHV